MEDFGIPSNPSQGILNIIQEAIRNDDTSPCISTFRLIADDTVSHPEDIPLVLSNILINLQSSAKEWRKLNKTLALSIVLLKFGNKSLIEELRKKISLFKELMEFFFIETRLDKGGVIRDKARLLYFMLNTPGFVESEREGPKTNYERPASTSWGIETNEKKFEAKKVEEPKFSPTKSIFDGVKVKTASNIFVQPKNTAIEKDLLGDIGQPEVPKQTVTKSTFIPEDLLLMSEEPRKDLNFPKNESILDFPLLIQTEKPAPNPETSEKKLETIEKRPETKAGFNISGQGLSMNFIKNSSNSISAAPQPPPPKKDLESRLLSLDDLTITPSEPKPKPRSYY